MPMQGMYKVPYSQLYDVGRRKDVEKRMSAQGGLELEMERAESKGEMKGKGNAKTKGKGKELKSGKIDNEGQKASETAKRGVGRPRAPGSTRPVRKRKPVVSKAMVSTQDSIDAGLGVESAVDGAGREKKTEAEM